MLGDHPYRLRGVRERSTRVRPGSCRRCHVLMPAAVPARSWVPWPAASIRWPRNVRHGSTVWSRRKSERRTADVASLPGCGETCHHPAAPYMLTHDTLHRGARLHGAGSRLSRRRRTRGPAVGAGATTGGGHLIPGSGGLRKLRWRGSGWGSSGGYRTTYYWRSRKDEIWLLTIYAKSEETDIPRHVLRAIRKEIEE